MYLAIISWPAYAMVVFSGCILYYALLAAKYGLLKNITSIKVKGETEYSINKMEEAELQKEGEQDPIKQNIVPNQQTAMAARFYNLTDEINALLLQAAAARLPREVLLDAIIRLVKGYGFEEKDADIIRSIKEIVINQASTICQFNYTMEELTI